MSKYQLIDRHLARENNEFIGKFRTGEMTPQRWDELFDNAHKKNPGLKNIHILDAMQTRTSIEEIEEAAIAARGSSPHLLVIIDSAHAMVRALRQGGKVSAYDATEDTITGSVAIRSFVERKMPLDVFSRRTSGVFYAAKE
jgi:hypothetical protein